MLPEAMCAYPSLEIVQEMLGIFAISARSITGGGGYVFASVLLLTGGLPPGLWSLVFLQNISLVLPLVLSKVLSRVHPGQGIPPQARTGGNSPTRPHGQESECCHAAGVKPLAVMQDDSLLVFGIRMNGSIKSFVTHHTHFDQKINGLKVNGRV